MDEEHLHQQYLEEWGVLAVGFVIHQMMISTASPTVSLGNISKFDHISTFIAFVSPLLHLLTLFNMRCLKAMNTKVPCFLVGEMGTFCKLDKGQLVASL